MTAAGALNVFPKQVAVGRKNFKRQRLSGVFRFYLDLPAEDIFRREILLRSPDCVIARFQSERGVGKSPGRHDRKPGRATVFPRNLKTKRDVAGSRHQPSGFVGQPARAVPVFSPAVNPSRFDEFVIAVPDESAALHFQIRAVGIGVMLHLSSCRIAGSPGQVLTPRAI